MSSLDPQLQELLDKYKAHFSLQENGKILCNINGHTLPPRYAEVSKFIQGPKFQKLLKRHQAEHALQKYEPFIVQSKNFPLMLYCALTGQLMDKSLQAVKKHMQGKKFLRAKERFTNDEIELKPEPSLESFGIKLPKGEEAEAAAAEDNEPPPQQQQQQQPQQRKIAGSKQKPQRHSTAANGTAANGTVANGAAAEDGHHSDEDDAPAFWVPLDEGASPQGADGSAQQEEAADSEQVTGSDELDDDDDVDMAEGAAAGGAGSDDDDDDAGEHAGPSTTLDPMDEDAPAQQQQTTVEAAASAKAPAGVGKGSKQQLKHKQQQQQQQQQQRRQQQQQPWLEGLNAPAAGGGRRKQNINRPSAAKKAKR